jgi:hypothetical protein
MVITLPKMLISNLESGSFAVIGNATLNKGFTVTSNYNGSVPTLDFGQANLTNNATSVSLTLNVNEQFPSAWGREYW